MWPDPDPNYYQALGGNVRDYYTTVDVLVIDGDPRHEWDTVDPWGTDSMANWYLSLTLTLP